MKHDSDGAEAPGPPDRGRSWTAEIEWREADDAARFVVVAAPAGSGRAVAIATSPPLAWPPSDSASVQALGDAAAALQSALVGAGWTPLAPGRAWYAKRFAWEPVAVAEPVRPSSPPAAHPLFAPGPGWPEGTADRWRCEIDWNAGWSRSRFRALTYAPGARRGREIKASRWLRWLLMAEPDPSQDEHRRELESLAAALTEGGWEPIGTGADWYATRFCWAGDGPPGDAPPVPRVEASVRDQPSDTYGPVVSQSEEDLERLLRNSTPTPRPGYVHELERSLRLRPHRRPARRLRLAIAASGLAAGLAAVVLVAAVVGLLPGSSGSPGGVQAKPRCQQVVVKRRIRQPYFVTDRQGNVQVRYRTIVAPRPVKRCR